MEERIVKNTTEYQNIHGNRTYKASLFQMIFKEKKELLSLYNAVNGTSYDNPDELEINTLENALYMNVKNDVSCIIDCTMNLYEHQSSYNPNMPLRGFFYFSKLYSKYVDHRKMNVFSETLQRIPTPQYIVFYNGLKEEPDHQVLRLSDAFLTDGGCLECEAVMLNINYGHNRELMEKCRPLAEYAAFIATVRRYAKDPKLSLSDTIDLSINECIEKGILKDILTKQRGEVHMSILETFDQELYERDLKELAAAKGRQEAHMEIIQKKLAKGKSIAEIADALEISVEEVQKLIEQIK